MLSIDKGVVATLQHYSNAHAGHSKRDILWLIGYVPGGLRASLSIPSCVLLSCVKCLNLTPKGEPVWDKELQFLSSFLPYGLEVFGVYIYSTVRTGNDTDFIVDFISTTKDNSALIFKDKKEFIIGTNKPSSMQLSDVDEIIFYSVSWGVPTFSKLEISPEDTVTKLQRDCVLMSTSCQYNVAFTYKSGEYERQLNEVLSKFTHSLSDYEKTLLLVSLPNHVNNEKAIIVGLNLNKTKTWRDLLGGEKKEASSEKKGKQKKPKDEKATSSVVVPPLLRTSIITPVSANWSQGSIHTPSFLLEELGYPLDFHSKFMPNFNRKGDSNRISCISPRCMWIYSTGHTITHHYTHHGRETM